MRARPTCHRDSTSLAVVTEAKRSAGPQACISGPPLRPASVEQSVKLVAGKYMMRLKHLLGSNCGAKEMWHVPGEAFRWLDGRILVSPWDPRACKLGQLAALHSVTNASPGSNSRD